MNIRWRPDEFMEGVNRRLVRGVTAGAILLKGIVQEVLSVPAPRRKARSRNGVVYYVATVRATPGAAPRMLNPAGLRASITYEINETAIRGRVGTNKVYGRRLERIDHRYLSVSLEASRELLRDTMMRAMAA